MGYRVSGLDPEPFRPLFNLSDGELEARGMNRMTVSAKPGFPCRVSLVDREIGEEVILLNHVSHDVPNPYRSTHAIFVSDSPKAEFVAEPPPVFAQRVLSLRGFDAAGMMADARIAQPGESEAGIAKLFANPTIAYIHVHNAAPGCFSASIERC